MTDEAISDIIRILKHSGPIEIYQLSRTELDIIKLKGELLGRDVYRNPDSAGNRTLEKCISDSTKGTRGEVALYHRLKEYFSDVVMNDEKATSEYHWDLNVKHCNASVLIEVKYQGLGTRWLSFSHSKKCDTAEKKWQDWHLMIAWKEPPDESLVIPYIAVNHEAFDPDLGFYRTSYYQGKYLDVYEASEYCVFLE